jgi:hypothetical protein
MIIQIIIGVILAITIYLLGYVRGAYKASDKNMKAYIKFKKCQGMNWKDMSEEILKIFKIRDTL